MWLLQLNFSAVIRLLSSMGYDDDKLEKLGERIGFADSVDVEELAAAGVPNRVLFDLRRRLAMRADAPRSVSTEVRGTISMTFAWPWTPWSAHGPIRCLGGTLMATCWRR